MGELEELSNRVDQAVQRLSAANQERRDQDQSLMAKLADLEEKNDALARENADLTMMVDRLVEIIADTANSEESYNMFRGSPKVLDVVAAWLSPEADEAPEPVMSTDGAPDDGPDNGPDDGPDGSPDGSSDDSMDIPA